MELNSKKNHLSRVMVSLGMLLFAMCLTMNVFFCGSYNCTELFDETSVSETWSISESIVAGGDGDNSACFVDSFLNKSKSFNDAENKNICSTPIIAAISEGISQLPFLIVVFLFLFLILFILLPDGWTLINHKVRLDN
ncbi:MAG: hypothetical protein Q4D16_07050 [Eubacteriales bacterium]|nr:hypothetical protein [Eubacteriales bacterium]